MFFLILISFNYSEANLGKECRDLKELVTVAEVDHGPDPRSHPRSLSLSPFKRRVRQALFWKIFDLYGFFVFSDSRQDENRWESQ